MLKLANYVSTIKLITSYKFYREKVSEREGEKIKLVKELSFGIREYLCRMLNPKGSHNWLGMSYELKITSLNFPFSLHLGQNLYIKRNSCPMWIWLQV